MARDYRPRPETLGDLPENLYPDRIERPQKRPELDLGRPRNIALRGRFSQQITNVTDSANTILNSNPRRVYFIVQNLGANPVYINFGNKAVPGNIRIIASGNYEPIICPVDSVSLVTDTGLTSICAVIEAVEVHKAVDF